MFEITEQRITVHKILELTFGMVAEDSRFRERRPFRHPKIHFENRAKEIALIKDDGTEERVGLLVIERLPLSGLQTNIKFFPGEIGNGLQIAAFTFHAEGNDIFIEIPDSPNSKFSVRASGKMLFDRLDSLIRILSEKYA